ncbi:hypothetical protein ACWGNA_20395 [Brucella cytisi]|uniref:hypothetical protein n=1 Tax=Brucella cytisi TaxID=407152 RepID=UPI0035DEF204
MTKFAPVSIMKTRVPFIGLLIFLSSPAFAEVADKEPTILQLWMVPGIITAIAFIAGLKRPSFSLFLLPIALICAWGQVDELHDPFVGPAIRAELGGAYFTHGYLSAAAGIVGPLIVWAAFRLYRVRAKH